MVVWMAEDRWCPASSTGQAGQRTGARRDQHAALPDRRQHAPARDAPDARASTKSAAARSASTSRSRSTPTPQPRDRRVHPHRPPDQRHGRRRHDPDRSELARWARASPTQHLHAPRAARSRPRSASARFGQRPCTVLLTGLTGAARPRSPTPWSAGCSTRAGRACLDGQNMRPASAATWASAPRTAARTCAAAPRSPGCSTTPGIIVHRRVRRPEGDVRQKAREPSAASGSWSSTSTPRSKSAASATPTGIYAAADRGEIPQFPGVSAPTTCPTNPDLVLDTVSEGVRPPTSTGSSTCSPSAASCRRVEGFWLHLILRL